MRRLFRGTGGTGQVSRGQARFAGLPHGTDWYWQPALWMEPLELSEREIMKRRAQLSEDVSLHHDDPKARITAVQTGDAAGCFALNLGVQSFSGSFLSLAIDVPKPGIDGLNRNHLLRVGLVPELSEPSRLYLRLNIRHGPNIEQKTLEWPVDQAMEFMEFDLAYASFDASRVGHVWLDVIFGLPMPGGICVRDLSLARYPRAAL